MLDKILRLKANVDRLQIEYDAGGRGAEIADGAPTDLRDLVQAEGAKIEMQYWVVCDDREIGRFLGDEIAGMLCFSLDEPQDQVEFDFGTGDCLIGDFDSDSVILSSHENRDVSLGTLQCFLQIWSRLWFVDLTQVDVRLLADLERGELSPLGLRVEEFLNKRFG